MKVYTAEEAGFCFGVKRALNLINRLHENGESIQIYGELIHNKTVMKDLENKGIFSLDSLEKLDPKKKLIIRTHGIPVYEEEELIKNGTKYEDLTCPLVKKIHNIIKNINNSETIIIVGNRNHPEIKAIKSFTKKGIVVNSLKEVKELPDFERVSVVAQTTLDTDFFNEIIEEIKRKFKQVSLFDTICYATKVRQEAVKRLAPKVDFVIVIGGHNSSNTKKLFEISGKFNKNTFHIDNSNELNNPDLQRSFSGFNSVGITAGASTPPEEIEKVKKFFQKFNN